MLWPECIGYVMEHGIQCHTKRLRNRSFKRTLLRLSKLFPPGDLPDTSAKLRRSEQRSGRF
jgi:hypothetical protein